MSRVVWKFIINFQPYLEEFRFTYCAVVPFAIQTVSIANSDDLNDNDW